MATHSSCSSKIWHKLWWCALLVNCLPKSKSFKSIQKINNKQYVELVYTKRRTLTKLHASSTTRYNCQTLETTFANPWKVSHTSWWSCHNVTKDEKCWTNVMYFYCSTNFKGYDKVPCSWHSLDWSWGFHNHKGMDKIVFETLHELVFSHGNHRS